MSVELRSGPRLSGIKSLVGLFLGQKFTFIRTRFFPTNQEHTVFCRVLHYVLTTGEYFSSWTLLHISLDCSFCPGRLETLEHLFLSCAFAKDVWGWATPFCKLLGDPGFVPSLGTLIGLDLVQGFPLATQKLAAYFLKLILYAIWHFRKMTCVEKVVSQRRMLSRLLSSALSRPV